MLSRNVTATIFGPNSRVTRSAAARYPAMSRVPLVTSAPSTVTPNTVCRSSSFATTTSTSRISGFIVACALASDQSFFLKLRSTLTLAPARFAAATAGFVAERGRDAGDVEPRRAVHRGVPGDGARIHLADRRARPIVDDRGGALTRAGLGEVDADAVAAAHDEARVDAFRPQRPHTRLA